MFTFISIMAVGVLIGYPLRRKQSIHNSSFGFRY